VEITEAKLVDSGGSIPGLLHDLRALGVRVSVDDFGTGFSTLSYFKRLPADTLKMDRSFVSGLPDDCSDVAITRTILALAANLGRRREAGPGPLPRAPRLQRAPRTPLRWGSPGRRFPGSCAQAERLKQRVQGFLKLGLLLFVVPKVTPRFPRFSGMPSSFFSQLN
jgi:hypothetical protein